MIPDGIRVAPSPLTINYCADQAARLLHEAEMLQDTQRTAAMDLAASWMELLDHLTVPELA